MGKPKAKKGSRPGKDQKQTSAKTVAYLRVSTIDQDLEKNKADILKLANDKNFGKVEFVEEKASGYKTGWKDRKVVRPGKVAYFSGWESRPGRLASHRVASPWIKGSIPRD